MHVLPKLRGLTQKQLYDFLDHGLVSMKHLIEICQVVVTVHGRDYGFAYKKVTSDVVRCRFAP